MSVEGGIVIAGPESRRQAANETVGVRQRLLRSDRLESARRSGEATAA
jgi:hypothetical protein